jgi:hypothetical protein
MNKVTLGVVLIVVGVVGLAAVYGMRPPSGFGEAIMMMGQGRENSVGEPYYQILLALFGLVTLFGVFLAASGWKAKSSG